MSKFQITKNQSFDIQITKRKVYEWFTESYGIMHGCNWMELNNTYFWWGTHLGDWLELLLCLASARLARIHMAAGFSSLRSLWKASVCVASFLATLATGMRRAKTSLLYHNEPPTSIEEPLRAVASLHINSTTYPITIHSLLRDEALQRTKNQVFHA